MVPRSLLAPPGVPDFFDRSRVVAAGRCVLEGRAWSGFGPIVRVEVSADGGETWSTPSSARTRRSSHGAAGRSTWDAEPGEHELQCRATDAAGNGQPASVEWNLGGYCNNVPQRVRVLVS